MADPLATYPGLEQRLEDRAKAWLLTHPLLGQYVIKERDQDTDITPETTQPKPVIIVVAKDEGRAHRLTPIRNMRLEIKVRANSKTPGGDATSFSNLGGTLEAFLDLTNLITALSGPLIGVMLATRTPGIGIRWNAMMREGTVGIEVKAVAAELTVGGSGVVTP